MLTALADAVVARPRRTLLAVLAFLVVAGVVGGPVAGTLRSSTAFAPHGAESQVAVRELERATGTQPDAGVVLLVDGVRGPGASARLTGAGARLRAVPGIASVVAPAARSADGSQALVTGTLRAGASEDDVAGAVLAAFAPTRGVVVGGTVVAARQIGDAVGEDLGRAEVLAFPLLLLLSLLIFRGRATILPLVVGLATVLGTFLALTGVNRLTALDVSTLNLTIGLGLGLSIDYTLFLLTRYRRELAEQGATPEAIRSTLRTAGRSVVFSAVTVSAALGTLTLFPIDFLRSMGIAGVIVPLVAATAALVATPPLLATWGSELARRGPAVAVGDGRWYRLAHAVMRRPGPVAAVTALLMLAACLPALRATWTPVDSTVIPTSQSARTVADALPRAFAGAGEAPITVAISAAPRQAAAVARYAASVRSVPGVRSVTPPRRLDATTWSLQAATGGDPAAPAARRVVQRIRALPAPFSARVAGRGAEFLDQQRAIGARLPAAVLLLVGLTFGVLLVMTRSLVLPVKAIVMNALTVGTALSPLVLIYQDGRLKGLLGYTANGGVEPTDFLLTAAIVFALSTDYGVFLLGRIKEAHDGGLPNREAVAHGLGDVGRVVTAAAILLAVAIGAFATSSISFIQQIGVATAAGVLVDAFVVRSLLVPSLMALLGEANWWAPRRRARRRPVVASADAA